MLDSFLISHFPYSAATPRPRRVLRGKERASLPFGMRARTHMQVFCAGRTHTPKRGFLHTTSCLRNSDINHPASHVLPPAPASTFFHSVLISGKHLFPPRWSRIQSPRSRGPGDDGMTRGGGGHREWFSLSLSCFLDGLLYLYTYNSMRHVPPCCGFCDLSEHPVSLSVRYCQ